MVIKCGNHLRDKNENDLSQRTLLCMQVEGEGRVTLANEIKISTPPLRPHLLPESIIFRERGKRSSPDTIVPG